MPRARKATPKMGRIAQAITEGQDIPPLDVIYQSDFCARLIKTYKLDCTVKTLENALISAGDAYLQAGPVGYVPFRTSAETEKLLEGVVKASRELRWHLGPAHNSDVFGLRYYAEENGLELGKTRGFGSKWA